MYKQCIIVVNKFIQNKDPYFDTGKKSKSNVTTPLSISFPWEWEVKPLAFFFKNFKIPKVPLSDSIPLNPKDTLV